MGDKAFFKENENKLVSISKNGEIQEYVFPWMCDSKIANFIYLQSLKPMTLVKYMLENYFRSRAATYVLI